MDGISDQLRTLVRCDGRRQADIVRATGGKVNKVSLCRFLAGNGVRLSVLDELGKALRVRIEVD